MADNKDLVYDSLHMGRSSIDLYSNDVGTPFSEITSFAAYVGGSPTNISVGGRRLGLKTAVVTGLGQDPVGDFILNFLNKEGVETQFSPRKPDHRTSAVVLGIEPPDKFPLVYYRDNCADIELTIEDVLAQWHDPRAFGVVARSVLHNVDVVIGTEDEINATLIQDMSQMSLTHSQVSDTKVEGDVQAAIERMLSLGPKAVIEKVGALGSRIHLADAPEPIEAPGYPVEVYNILGAGDAFGAGFIYGYVNGWDWRKASRLGNACGAIVVQAHGCANFMPTYDEVMAFVESRGGLD